MIDFKTVTEEAAAYVLVDDIDEMKRSLEKAELAAGELWEYFTEYDELTEKGRNFILGDYQRFRVYTAMAMDYLYEIRQVLKALSVKAETGSEERDKQRQAEREQLTGEKKQGAA